MIVTTVCKHAYLVVNRDGHTYNIVIETVMSNYLKQRYMYMYNIATLNCLLKSVLTLVRSLIVFLTKLCLAEAFCYKNFKLKMEGLI